MKNKGITVVALVITIIVLLIITGISAQVLIGDNGILKKIEEAKTAMDIGSEKEKIQLTVLQTIQNNKTLQIKKNKLEQNLITNIGKDETELREDGTNYLVKIVKSQRYYSVKDNGEVTFLGYASEVEKDLENILLGDNLFNLADIKNNTYISNSDGSEISYNGWSSSDYIDLGTCKNILIVSDSSSFLDSYNALYNENKETQRILRINKATITNDVLGKVEVSLTILKLQENERYLRISQKSSLLNHIKIFPILNEDYNDVIGLDLCKSLVGEYTFGDNIFENGKIIDNTYISSTDGAEIKYNSAWNSTDFIDVENYTRVAISYEKTSPITSYSAMYDAEKNYVSGLSVDVDTLDLEKGKIVILSIPKNVKYIRLSQITGILNTIKVFPIQENNLSNNYTYQNIKIEDSIFDSKQLTLDHYIETNGEEVSYSGWAETDYLDLSNYNSVIVLDNDNMYNAIYDENKKFLKTLNFSGGILYNPKIGKIGAEISYIKVTPAFKYLRLSNSTSKLRNVRIYPVLNTDFNKHLVFNINTGK